MLNLFDYFDTKILVVIGGLREPEIDEKIVKYTTFDRICGVIAIMFQLFQTVELKIYSTATLAAFLLPVVVSGSRI